MPKTPDRLDTLLAALREFVREREWEQFHDPKNLAMCLGAEAGELLAEYRWVPTTEAAIFSAEATAKARITQELGDIGIVWLLLCDSLALDPIEVVEAKVRHNQLKYPVELSRGRANRP